VEVLRVSTYSKAE